MAKDAPQIAEVWPGSVLHKSKQLYVADTLSNTYQNVPCTDDVEHLLYVDFVALPVSDTKLQPATQDNEQLQQLHQYITTGWPSSINSVPLSLWSY